MGVWGGTGISGCTLDRSMVSQAAVHAAKISALKRLENCTRKLSNIGLKPSRILLCRRCRYGVWACGLCVYKIQDYAPQDVQPRLWLARTCTATPKLEPEIVSSQTQTPV